MWVWWKDTGEALPSFFLTQLKHHMPFGPIQGVGHTGIQVSQNSSSVAPVLPPWGKRSQWVARGQLDQCSERKEEVSQDIVCEWAWL